MANVPIYVRSDSGNFPLLTKDPQGVNLAKILEEKKFGQLYIDAADKKEFYEGRAKNYLDHLQQKLDDQNIQTSELATLVIDWVDMSLGEMIINDSNQAARHLKRFVRQMLTGLAGGRLNDLMTEIGKFDYSTAQHAMETMILTLNYFDSLPERNNRLNEVGAMAALLHDVGKQAIDTKILNKNGPLTPEEYEIVKKHPELGREILTTIDFQALGFNQDEEKMIKDAEYEHQEREDGSGYPLGKKSEEISKYGQILAVIDVFSAVRSSTRAYREALSQEQAIQLIRDQTQPPAKLNKYYVEAFIRSLGKLES